MLPRMIDIARAKLPDGNVGDYQIGRDKTLSAAVLDAFGISAGQFVNIVRDARTDEDVAEHLWVAGNARPKALTARLRRVTVADIAADRRPDFERLYGTNPMTKGRRSVGKMVWRQRTLSLNTMCSDAVTEPRAG